MVHRILEAGDEEGVTSCDASCDAVTEKETSFAALVRDGMSLAEAYRKTHPEASAMKAGSLRMAAKRLADKLGLNGKQEKEKKKEHEQQKVAASAEVLEEVRQEVRGVLKGQIADDGELQAGLTELFRSAVNDGDRMGAVRIAAELRTWKGLLPREGGEAVLPVAEVVAELTARPFESIAKDL